QPLAQNAFEALRKPHIVADNLEPPAALAADPPATPAAEEPAQPAAMELASAESKPVKLPELPAATAKPAVLASANVSSVPAPAAPQATLSETPPPTAARSRFPIHSRVLALCGALGAAGALRFIVGAGARADGAPSRSRLFFSSYCLQWLRRSARAAARSRSSNRRRLLSR